MECGTSLERFFFALVGTLQICRRCVRLCNFSMETAFRVKKEVSFTTKRPWLASTDYYGHRLVSDVGRRVSKDRKLQLRFIAGMGFSGYDLLQASGAIPPAGSKAQQRCRVWCDLSTGIPCIPPRKEESVDSAAFESKSLPLQREPGHFYSHGPQNP